MDEWDEPPVGLKDVRAYHTTALPIDAIATSSKGRRFYSVEYDQPAGTWSDRRRSSIYPNIAHDRAYDEPYRPPPRHVPSLTLNVEVYVYSR